MPSPNWSTTTPRAAWYYVRNAPGSSDFTRHYTTWMEIMRDARANLGVAPTPYAWNPTFTAAMERFLLQKGASQEAVNAALAPIKRENATFDNRLVMFAIYAARFPNMPWSQFLTPGGEQAVQLSASPAELAGITYPQYAMQLIQGSNDPLVPNSTGGGTSSTTGGTTTTGGGGTKPPGGGAAQIEGSGPIGTVKPGDTTTTTGGGSTGGTGTTGGGGTGSTTGGGTTTTGGGTTTTGGGTAGGGTAGGASNLTTNSASSLGQNWRIALVVIGALVLVAGMLFLLTRDPGPGPRVPQDRRFPSNA